ncbi:MAG: hypothetical protein ACFCVK_16075 [Acidimicrobiales bacterium]
MFGSNDQRSCAATTRRPSFTPSSTRSPSWIWNPTLTRRKALAIGPDPAGNLLEVMWLDLADTELVIHAMALRPSFSYLLPTGEDPTP